MEYNKVSPESVNGSQAAPAQSPHEIERESPAIEETPTITWSDDRSSARGEEPFDIEQIDTRKSEAMPQKPPVRDLHVKVWEQEKQAERETRHASLPPPILGVQTPRIQEVTDLDTVPLSAQHQQNPALVPAIEPADRPHPQAGDHAGQPLQAPPERPVGAGQAPGLYPSAIPPLVPMAVSPGVARPKSRVPLVFTFVLLGILILGGLAAWFFVFQPFSVPQMTQPQQDFQDTLLGISLAYPTGWTSQVDRKNGVARFSDSTHTDQFSIMVAPANGQDVAQYLLQAAAHQGISNPKPGTPVSFAQSSWQQTQGTLQQNGANYTATVLVTVHGNRLYSIIQQAPQATYNEVDRVIFSPMRSSLHFLS